MRNATPFFPGFHRILFGRPSRSAQEKLRVQTEALRRASLCQLAKLFESWVPPAQLAPTGSQRRRHFPTATIFWAFLSQVLNPGSACREALRKVQAWCATHKLPVPDSNTAAYCTARKRLDADTLRDIHRHGADRLERNLCGKDLWCGRRVKVIDGTGVSMPDTPANQKAFAQPSSQKPGCGFPVMRILGCFSLGSGALITWVESNLKVHEHALFRTLWPLFVKDDVVLGDRAFCSFEATATLLMRGVDSVMRLHQARTKDFRRGKRIDKNQRLVLWRKPKKRPPDARARQWNKLPDSLPLRYVKIHVATPGFRTEELIIVTTLTDTEVYSLDALGELYFRRWSVELFYRDIKISMGMDVLRCKSPDMVRKEIIMHAIGYNLIRALMQEAAALYRVELCRISFKGSADTLRQWTDALNAAANKPRELTRLKDQLLALLAEDQLPFRPGRVEPRAKKRRPKNYQLLTKPRHEMLVPPHRNRG
jgi:hypothetical protein